MASLVLDAHDLLKRAEQEILNANADKRFLIDKNSSVTNIDVLQDYFKYNRISDKSKLRPELLTVTENVAGMM
jgi:hypothetical protein